MSNEHTDQVHAEDAEQAQSWLEVGAAAGTVSQIAPHVVAAATGEVGMGLAGAEAAGIALDGVITGGAIGLEGGIALAGGALGEGALLAGGAVAAEVAGAAAFATVAAPVVAVAAVGAAALYGLDYITDGAISDGAEAVGEAVYDGAEAVGDAIGDAWDWLTD
jgi:hypothetical protein